MSGDVSCASGSHGTDFVPWGRENSKPQGGLSQSAAPKGRGIAAQANGLGQLPQALQGRRSRSGSREERSASSWAFLQGRPSRESFNGSDDQSFPGLTVGFSLTAIASRNSSFPLSPPGRGGHALALRTRGPWRSVERCSMSGEAR